MSMVGTTLRVLARAILLALIAGILGGWVADVWMYRDSVILVCVGSIAFLLMSGAAYFLIRFSWDATAVEALHMLASDVDADASAEMVESAGVE